MLARKKALEERLPLKMLRTMLGEVEKHGLDFDLIELAEEVEQGTLERSPELETLFRARLEELKSALAVSTTIPSFP